MCKTKDLQPLSSKTFFPGCNKEKKIIHLKLEILMSTVYCDGIFSRGLSLLIAGLNLVASFK